MPTWPPDCADLAARLQRRVARLLLHHDPRTFRGRFREWYAHSAAPLLPALRAYDDFVRLLLLTDELLDELLPRIERQVSLQSVPLSRQEEPPLRGQIDWDASLERAWSEQPGQLPTRFATRQRSHSFATPENMLLVALLARCAAALAQARTAPLFADAPLSPAEQTDIAARAERLRRAAAASYLHDLADLAAERDPDDLAASVEQRLPPGGSPYRDLLDWWRRFGALHLPGTAAAQAAPVLENPQHLDALYHLWLALELLDLLTREGALDAAAVQPERLDLQVRWRGRDLRLCCAPHGCYIGRAEPLRVEHAGQTIWHEPPVLLHTAADPAAAADALLRLHGALRTAAADYGLLVVASAPPAPDPAPAADVRCFHLLPLESLDALHAHLHALLDQAAAWLPERPPILCQGALQDADTVNPGGMPARICARCGALLALCPRPHIGPEVVGLVCPQCDCLREPTRCHILGDEHSAALIPPFVRRVLSGPQLVSSAKQVRERVREHYRVDDESGAAEQARVALLQTMGELTESYVTWRQPDALMSQIEEKLRWAFGPLWDASQHPRGLPEDVRNMLISGEYVWNEFVQLGMKDWAACAVQYVRALERELRRRLYARCGNPSALRYYGRPMSPHQFTFGSVSRAYRKRHHAEPDPNWNTLLEYAASTSAADAAAFEALIGDIARLRRSRNQIAHATRIDRGIAGTARTAILGQPGEEGVLRRLAALLDPA
jgi:hypothetical protein